MQPANIMPTIVFGHQAVQQEGDGGQFLNWTWQFSQAYHDHTISVSAGLGNIPLWGLDKFQLIMGALPYTQDSVHQCKRA